MSSQAALLTTFFLAEPARELVIERVIAAPELAAIPGRAGGSSESRGTFLLHGRYLEPSVGGPRRRGRRILGAYA